MVGGVLALVLDEVEVEVLGANNQPLTETTSFAETPERSSVEKPWKVVCEVVSTVAVAGVLLNDQQKKLGVLDSVKPAEVRSETVPVIWLGSSATAVAVKDGVGGCHQPVALLVVLEEATSELGEMVTVTS
jgi:hypothetical protein